MPTILTFGRKTRRMKVDSLYGQTWLYA